MRVSFRPESWVLGASLLAIAVVAAWVEYGPAAAAALAAVGGALWGLPGWRSPPVLWGAVPGDAEGSDAVGPGGRRPRLGRDGDPAEVPTVVGAAIASALPALAAAQVEMRMLAGRVAVQRDEGAQRLASSALRSLIDARHGAELARSVAAHMGNAPRPFDLARVVATVVESRRSALAERGTRLHVAAAEPVPVFGHPAAVAEVVQALIDEGVEACAAVTRPGRLDVRVSRDGATARIEVADSGRLVRLLSPQRREPGGRAASPFAPGGPLAIARDLMRAQGGELRLRGEDPALRGGLRVVELPIAREPVVPAAQADGDAPDPAAVTTPEVAALPRSAARS